MTDVVAVIVTLRDQPSVRAVIATVRAASTTRDVQVVCVVNDPGQHGIWLDDGVLFVGAGMNLGWAAGMHAGVAAAAGTYVWAVHDDMAMAPRCLDILCDALDADPGLAAVRALSVDGTGMVLPRDFSGRVDADGRWGGHVLAQPTHPRDLADPPTGDFILSSGMLLRRDVWDALGGFDPWFYPWGHVDIDFGRTLRESGWRFANVAEARMSHARGGSTTSMFRDLCNARNRQLFAGKWSGIEPGDREHRPLISQAIIDLAREGRARPRDTTLPSLQHIAGVAAADLMLSTIHWMGDDAAFDVAKALIRQPSMRRALARDVRAAVGSRWPI